MLSWASTLVVARLLSPNDYGLVSMASAYLGLITIFSEFGIGIAVITIRDLTEAQLDQLHTLSVALGMRGVRHISGGCLPGVVVLQKSSTTRGHHRNESYVRDRGLPLGAVFAVAAGHELQGAVIDRRRTGGGAVRGDGRARAGGIQVLDTRGGGPGKRIRQHHPYLGCSPLRISLAAPGSTEASHHYQLAHAGEPAGVVHLFECRLCGGGKSSGRSRPGRLHRGLDCRQHSGSGACITSLVGSVTTAFFSTVQKDYGALRRYLLNLTEGLALLTFPLSIGLALVVNDFVLLVLGSKWQAVVPSLRLLALYASVRSITPLLSHVLTVTGDTASA